MGHKKKVKKKKIKSKIIISLLAIVIGFFSVFLLMQSQKLEKYKDEFSVEVNAANYCKKASDCLLFMVRNNCVSPCGKYINVGSNSYLTRRINEIESMAATWNLSSGMCYYKCDFIYRQKSKPVCVENRCVQDPDY